MSTVYLVPSFLSEAATETIPVYVIEQVKKCTVIFAENERSARRFLKKMDKDIIIDDYEWFTIHKAEKEQLNSFIEKIKEGKNIAIISEAGCPGIADPGQILIAEAQKMHCDVRPLVGPSSILLALMASGFNGQQFEFVGYLPIDAGERQAKLKFLENSSAKNDSTKIFIETPFRNNQLLESILKTCQQSTLLCIGIDITSPEELIKTLTISEWKKIIPDLHKKQAIFLLYVKSTY